MNFIRCLILAFTAYAAVLFAAEVPRTPTPPENPLVIKISIPNGVATTSINPEMVVVDDTEVRNGVTVFEYTVPLNTPVGKVKKLTRATLYDCNANKALIMIATLLSPTDEVLDMKKLMTEVEDVTEGPMAKEFNFACTRVLKRANTEQTKEKMI